MSAKNQSWSSWYPEPRSFVGITISCILLNISKQTLLLMYLPRLYVYQILLCLLMHIRIWLLFCCKHWCMHTSNLTTCLHQKTSEMHICMRRQSKIWCTHVGQEKTCITVCPFDVSTSVLHRKRHKYMSMNDLSISPKPGEPWSYSWYWLDLL